MDTPTLPFPILYEDYLAALLFRYTALSLTAHSLFPLPDHGPLFVPPLPFLVDNIYAWGEESFPPVLTCKF